MLTIFIKFDDPEAGQKLIGTNRVARQNSWVPVKKADNIFVGSCCNSLSIQRTQFPSRLLWACTIHKVQGLILSRAVVSFNFKKQKTFRPGDRHVCCFEQN